jgi:hypothetical protein
VGVLGLTAAKNGPINGCAPVSHRVASPTAMKTLQTNKLGYELTLDIA